jgi:hypothetical protein
MIKRTRSAVLDCLQKGSHDVRHVFPFRALFFTVRLWVEEIEVIGKVGLGGKTGSQIV